MSASGAYAPQVERAFDLVGLPAETFGRPHGVEVTTPIDGLALVAEGAFPDLPAAAPRFAAVPDGNRAAVLVRPRVAYAGREWLVSVKGVGALAPMFGDTLPARRIHGESWMGEAPFGGQGELGARTALAITERWAAGELRGAEICPVVAVVVVPDRAVDRGSFWYRRYRGPVLAEQRLVPSDVRVFHGGSRTLGRAPEDALEAFGVRDVPALDAFVDRYLATGIALLTLAARSARSRALAPGEPRSAPTAHGERVGLDYDDAWLDKDAVVAPDGTLAFADLETLDERALTPERITRQIGRNHYELFATLDVLLDIRDAWAGTASTRETRRASVITRIELALAHDPVARPRVTSEGLELDVTPAGGPTTSVRLVDHR